MAPASRIPLEVLHQVYELLQPCDFDAARHTCWSWFLASLDPKVGRHMMQKAGCLSAFLADLEHREQFFHATDLRSCEGKELYPEEQDPFSDRHSNIQQGLDEDWLISKRLATECRLSASWHGSGLLQERDHSTSRLVVTHVANFERLALLSKTNKSQIRKFTVSTCGKYILVIAGTDVFVYSLHQDGAIMQSCARLITGKKVLCVSMDTSSGRYAVAALLEGRTGMCWELGEILNGSMNPVHVYKRTLVNIRDNVSSSAPLSACQSVISLALPDRTEEYSPAMNREQRDARVMDFNHAAQFVCPRTDTVQSFIHASPVARSSCGSISVGEPAPTDPLEALPICTRPTSIYKNLGTANDSPSSVAICPQRKCVAFGCRTGIELHWVDGLSGRDLSRWFPLASPSDFLYFLPQRPGHDSTKKLRLISSAAGPVRHMIGRHNSTPTNSRFSASGPRHGRQRSMTRLFFGSLPFPGPSDQRHGSSQLGTEDERQGLLRTVDCDHYQAVPLSDGTHVIFTDPESGVLCLGSDAPLGGPSKFNRKVCMTPPSSDDLAGGSLNCYAAGRDLAWGLRIVAAYDDGNIVLYNIPSDCFERIRYSRSSPDVWDELSGVVGQSDLLMDALMVQQDEFPDHTHSMLSAPGLETPPMFRSLHINGALICRVDTDVEGLQIDSSSGGLKVWIFHRSGRAVKMDLYAPRYQHVRQHNVGIDGILRDCNEP